MKTLSKPKGYIEIAAQVGYALRQIDDRICTPEAKAKLEVNRPKRVVPHYQFVPSLVHPDPFGFAPGGLKENQVHKKVGKKSTSRRSR